MSDDTSANASESTRADTSTIMEITTSMTPSLFFTSK